MFFSIEKLSFIRRPSITIFITLDKEITLISSKNDSEKRVSLNQKTTASESGSF